MKIILISILIIGIIGVIFYFSKYNETFNQTTTSISNKKMEIQVIEVNEVVKNIVIWVMDKIVLVVKTIIIGIFHILNNQCRLH